MLRHLPLIFRQVFRRAFRIRASLAIACWLLLNMQLAVASHHATAPDASSSATHNSIALTPDMDNPGQKVICEKHCYPDGSQSSSAFPQINAVLSDITLLPVPPKEKRCSHYYLWERPPVTGPPAEVRFCRFRE